jgi:Beta-lactamase class C and other penicillin binding proteins
MRLKRRGVRHLFAASVAVVAALMTSACTGQQVVPVTGPAQSAGSLPSSVEKQLTTAVAAAMKLAGASGAIAGVWAPWSGSWTAAEGSTAHKGGTPMSTQMTFRVGQNTRSMTCTVLLELADEGIVKLDDRASKFLPYMVDIGGITLRQLCQNTAGLGDFTTALAPQFVNNPTRTWPQLELLTDGLAEARVANPVRCTRIPMPDTSSSAWRCNRPQARPGASCTRSTSSIVSA